MSSIAGALGRSLGKKKRERLAETKYDYNYTDRAMAYREGVAAARQVSDQMPASTGQRWHMFDNDRYWDEAYYIPPDRSVADERHDAYNDFAAAYPHVEPYLDNINGVRILVIGCGTSAMARELVKLGFCNIVNADLSPVLVKRLLEDPDEALEGVDIVCVDATELYMYVRMLTDEP